MCRLHQKHIAREYIPIQPKIVKYFCPHVNCYNHQETKETKQQPTTAYVITTIITITNSYKNDELMNMLHIIT
jgi:hypothetical protein